MLSLSLSFPLSLSLCLSQAKLSYALRSQESNSPPSRLCTVSSVERRHEAVVKMLFLGLASSDISELSL